MIFIIMLISAIFHEALVLWVHIRPICEKCSTNSKFLRPGTNHILLCRHTNKIPILTIMVLRAHTYNDHLADVPAAELRVRGILHIEHPAGDENAQPCQEKVLHLNGWETALVVGRDKRVGEKRMRNH